MSERKPYLSELPGFVPLPSQPSELTRDHALLLFGAKAADDFVRSLKEAPLPLPAAPNAQHHTPGGAAVPTGALNGR